MVFKTSGMRNFSFFLLCLSLLTACNSSRIAGNYSYETECLGVELDGSQTVKAWGNGRNRFDATEQAKKEAVNDIIFSGILKGKQDCQVRPLVVEVNAREKYEDYFNVFFADNGKFTDFVSLKDARLGKKIKGDRFKSKSGITYGVILRVQRSELRKLLMKDSILK
tara:strand:- start:78 stop:575 length:498 start_codon:yes stop_codon:yes gene_type:complete